MEFYIESQNFDWVHIYIYNLSTCAEGSCVMYANVCIFVILLNLDGKLTFVRSRNLCAELLMNRERATHLQIGVICAPDSGVLPHPGHVCMRQYKTIMRSSKISC